MIEQLELGVPPTSGWPAAGDEKWRVLKEHGPQLSGIRTVMKDGQWMTYHEIWDAVSRLMGERQNFDSVRAQVRHLRKQAYGGHEVASRQRTGRVLEFQFRQRLDPTED